MVRYDNHAEDQIAGCCSKQAERRYELNADQRTRASELLARLGHVELAHHATLGMFEDVAVVHPSA